MSCLVSASNHMVVLRASSSSLVSQSLARSHIQGGSVTWASQSKVGKSFVMGANCWMGILGLLWGIQMVAKQYSESIRHKHDTKPCHVSLTSATLQKTKLSQSDRL